MGRTSGESLDEDPLQSPFETPASRNELWVCGPDSKNASEVQSEPTIVHDVVFAFGPHHSYFMSLRSRWW